jgi:hypothetical protein
MVNEAITFLRKSRLCLMFYIILILHFLKIVTVSSLKISISTMVFLTDTHMIMFIHNIIPIIQAQIRILFQGNQCTPLFSINPDMCKLGCCPLSSPLHPLSLPTIRFLHSTVVFGWGPEVQWSAADIFQQHQSSCCFTVCI